VWSLGVLLFAMLWGYVPFKAYCTEELYRIIGKGHYTVPYHVSPEATSLLQRMLTVKPDSRITLSEILKHQWLQDSESKTEKIPWPEFVVKTQEINRTPNSCAMINQKVVSKVAKLGFPRSFVVNSLQENEMNHGTATYHLLMKYSSSCKRS
jgi:serine/threonine protein kinase